MRTIYFIFFKEFLEFKNSKHLIFSLLGQSFGYGIIFPAITWLMMSGILPMKFEGVSTSDLGSQWDKLLTVYYPTLLPFFIASILSKFSLPSISYDIENNTIEHFLVLPISWFHIVSGKWLFYTFVGLICSYIVGASYWIGAFIVSPKLYVDYLTAFFTLFIFGVTFYVTNISLLISALSKETKT